jgi:RNA polymerase sigma-70 factor (ECF subfamily)
MIMCTADNARAMFNSVYDDCHTEIPGYANYFLDNREEARDISTDSFIKLWVRRESFSSTHKMRSFVKKCTHNACLNHLKSIRRRKKRDYDIIQRYYLPVTAEILETDTESREDALIRVIQSLDKKYQQCILLFYFEKITCANIASRLNISERNVRFFLTKGRGIIRSALSSN